MEDHGRRVTGSSVDQLIDLFDEISLDQVRGFTGSDFGRGGQTFGAGVRQVTLRYGFMQEMRVADDLRDHLGVDPTHTDYFLGRETVRSTDRPGMARWREGLFAVMARNASDAVSHFHLPDDRVVEIGQRLEL